MSVTLAVELNHPDLGKGRVEITCTAIPHDAFIPLALSQLGKDDAKMAELLGQIVSSMTPYDDDDDFDDDEEDFGEPEDEPK